MEEFSRYDPITQLSSILQGIEEHNSISSIDPIFLSDISLELTGNKSELFNRISNVDRLGNYLTKEQIRPLFENEKFKKIDWNKFFEEGEIASRTDTKNKLNKLIETEEQFFAYKLIEGTTSEKMSASLGAQIKDKIKFWNNVFAFTKNIQTKEVVEIVHPYYMTCDWFRNIIDNELKSRSSHLFDIEKSGDYCINPADSPEKAYSIEIPLDANSKPMPAYLGLTQSEKPHDRYSPDVCVLFFLLRAMDSTRGNEKKILEKLMGDLERKKHKCSYIDGSAFSEGKKLIAKGSSRVTSATALNSTRGLPCHQDAGIATSSSDPKAMHSLPPSPPKMLREALPQIGVPPAQSEEDHAAQLSREREIRFEDFNARQERTRRFFQQFAQYIDVIHKGEVNKKTKKTMVKEIARKIGVGEVALQANLDKLRKDPNCPFNKPLSQEQLAIVEEKNFFPAPAQQPVSTNPEMTLEKYPSTSTASLPEPGNIEPSMQKRLLKRKIPNKQPPPIRVATLLPQDTDQKSQGSQNLTPRSTIIPQSVTEPSTSRANAFEDMPTLIRQMPETIILSGSDSDSEGKPSTLSVSTHLSNRNQTSVRQMKESWPSPKAGSSLSHSSFQVSHHKPPPKNVLAAKNPVIKKNSLGDTFNKDIDSATLKEWIADIMKSKNTSCTKMADVLIVNRSTLNRWLAGTRTPRKFTIQQRQALETFAGETFEDWVAKRKRLLGRVLILI